MTPGRVVGPLACFSGVVCPFVRLSVVREAPFAFVRWGHLALVSAGVFVCLVV